MRKLNVAQERPADFRKQGVETVERGSEDFISGEATDGTVVQTFTISELAKRFSLTMRALRFYEEKGLLSPQRRGNRRLYREADVNALEDIVRLKAMGVAISDIQKLLRQVRSGQIDAAKNLLISISDKRIQEIRVEIERLQCETAYAESAASQLSTGEDWFKSR